MKKIVLTLASLLALTTSTQAQLNFAPPVNYNAGANPISVVSADFNGDGKKDLAVANLSTNNVSILLGSGTGTFAAAVNYGAGSSPTSVFTTDFNGDGKMDLAISNRASNNVSILLGSGTGTFAAAVNFAVGSSPESVFSADFNGDGKMDLATANSTTNNMSVLLGSGTGTFATAVNYVVGAGPQSVFSADFNGDGKMDLVVANGSVSSVSVLLGSGIGTFATAVNYNTGSSPFSVFSADFNNDGKMDLVTANRNSNNASVLIGSGTGSFATAVDYNTGSNCFTVLSTDFNGDGNLDLATANSGSSNVSLLLGSGTGTFAATVNYSLTAGPFRITSNDFNGDGKPDLATANVVSSNVSVLLNTSIYPFGEVLNFDGVNDFVQIADNANLDFGSGDFTVEYWVKKKDNSSSFSNLGGVNKWNTPLSPGTNEWSLGLTETGNDNLPSFWIESGTTTYKCPATTPLILNNWYHIAAVRQGTNIKIFVNGKLENTIAIGNISVNNVASRNLLIGKLNVGVHALMSIDELRIWNVARTQCEINTFKNCEIPTTAAGLIINSHFNQGIANSDNSAVTSLTNVSGTANTGTLTNFDLTGSVSNWAVTSVVVSGYTTTANVTPTVSAVASNSVICFGNSTTLNGAGANTYTWTGSVTDAVAFTPTVTSTYTVIGTSSLTGCSNAAINTITVNTLPTLTVNNATVCLGQSFTMVPTGAVTYTFSNGSSVATPTAFTTYTVIGTDNNGCLGSTTSTGLVNALPIVTLNSGVICAGQSFTLIPNGASTYTLSSGTNVVSPNTNTTYYVSGTDSNGCTSSSDGESDVDVNPLPVILINSGAICIDQSFTLSPSGASTYTYSNGSNIVNPTASANYTVTGTDANGCVGSAVSSVTVNALPTILATTGNTLLCTGQTANLTATGATSYTWNTTATTPVISVTPTTTTTYTVNGIDANGCENITLITQNVSTCTGIDNSKLTSNNLQFILYPNPNNGILNIEFLNFNNEVYKVEIVNALGQIVLGEIATTQNVILKTNTLNNGIYFVSLIQNNKLITTQKIIKQ